MDSKLRMTVVSLILVYCFAVLFIFGEDHLGLAIGAVVIGVLGIAILYFFWLKWSYSQINVDERMTTQYDSREYPDKSPVDGSAYAWPDDGYGSNNSWPYPRDEYDPYTAHEGGYAPPPWE